MKLFGKRRGDGGSLVLTALAALVGILVLGCGDPSQESATSGPQSSPGQSSEDRAARVEAGLVPLTENAEPQWDERASLADRMRLYATPAVGIAVIEQFEIAWSRGYGRLRAGGDEPVTKETLFHAGSVAKTLAAAAALMLVEEGRLGLDRDVGESLRSWRLPESELARQEKVTLRRLLSHTAGLEDGMTNRSIEDPVPSYFTPAGVVPTVAIEDLLDAAPGVDVDGPTRVAAVPGSRYRYANADYAIVELLVEDVTGEPFARFMEQRVLAPLAMQSSTYQQPLPARLRSRAVVEHDRLGEPLAGERLHIPLLAAGGLWTTPSDLARFVVEILRAHRGDPERVILQATARGMLTPQIAIANDPLADASGLGFHLGGDGEKLYAVHTGATWGSTALVWAYPATGQGAVIMTNSATGSLLRIEILLSIAAEYGWPIEP